MALLGDTQVDHLLQYSLLHRRGHQNTSVGPRYLADGLGNPTPVTSVVQTLLKCQRQELYHYTASEQAT